MLITLLKIVAVLFILGICGVWWMRTTSWGTSAKSSFTPASGKFAPCPESPNCVSTQSPAEDKEHSIAPIAFSGSVDEAKARLLSILQAMPRTTILNNDVNYIQTEMRTALMGYVDDVEFFLDAATQTIQFRSASRIGYGDMGMNRKRMEEIRGKFAGK